ncbi:transcriptional regulator [Haloarcula onubensis]|uniref:HVO_A0114 family putative DNA-binding protein n=1 Tax=Haloarcula onubensis TaxID=2950539 RepID=UPI003AAEA567
MTVADREQLQEETLQFMLDAEAGEQSDQDEKSVIQFGSYNGLGDSHTPLRLELIQVIAEGTPRSMCEAARLVDRDVSDVHSDLKYLEVLGSLQLEDGGPSGAMQPVVPFDRIEDGVTYRGMRFGLHQVDRLRPSTCAHG